jgi:hypothetical protein
MSNNISNNIDCHFSVIKVNGTYRILEKNDIYYDMFANAGKCIELLNDVNKALLNIKIEDIFVRAFIILLLKNSERIKSYKRIYFQFKHTNGDIYCEMEGEYE